MIATHCDAQNLVCGPERAEKLPGVIDFGNSIRTARDVDTKHLFSSVART